MAQVVVGDDGGGGGAVCLADHQQVVMDTLWDEWFQTMNLRW